MVLKSSRWIRICNEFSLRENTLRETECRKKERKKYEIANRYKISKIDITYFLGGKFFSHHSTFYSLSLIHIYILYILYKYNNLITIPISGFRGHILLSLRDPDT